MQIMITVDQTLETSITAGGIDFTAILLQCYKCLHLLKGGVDNHRLSRIFKEFITHLNPEELHPHE